MMKTVQYGRHRNAMVLRKTVSFPLKLGLLKVCVRNSRPESSEGRTPNGTALHSEGSSHCSDSDTRRTSSRIRTGEKRGVKPRVHICTNLFFAYHRSASSIRTPRRLNIRIADGHVRRRTTALDDRTRARKLWNGSDPYEGYLQSLLSRIPDTAFRNSSPRFDHDEIFSKHHQHLVKTDHVGEFLRGRFAVVQLALDCGSCSICAP